MNPRCVCGHSAESHDDAGFCLIGDGPDDPDACPCYRYRPSNDTSLLPSPPINRVTR